MKQKPSKTKLYSFPIWINSKDCLSLGFEPSIPEFLLSTWALHYLIIFQKWQLHPKNLFLFWKISVEFFGEDFGDRHPGHPIFTIVCSQRMSNWWSHSPVLLLQSTDREASMIFFGLLSITSTFVRFFHHFHLLSFY